MSLPDELIQEFRDTHNQIIQSLNDAEKSHAETLAVFIGELEKRKETILGVNARVAQFNDLVKTMAVRLDSTNQRINDLSVLAGDMEFKLKNLQDNVALSLQDVGKTAFKDFFRKARLLLILNLVFMAVLAYVALR